MEAQIKNQFSKDELLELQKTFKAKSKLWEQAFEYYNLSAVKKLSMRCVSCYYKVFKHIKHTSND